MAIFSKTTVLEKFKHYGVGLYKEDGKTPFREYRLDEYLIPEKASYLEGNWTITVTFIPKDLSEKDKK